MCSFIEIKNKLWNNIWPYLKVKCGQRQTYWLCLTIKYGQKELFEFVIAYKSWQVRSMISSGGSFCHFKYLTMAKKIIRWSWFDHEWPSDIVNILSFIFIFNILSFLFICTLRTLNSSKRGKTDGIFPVFIIMKHKSWSNMLTMCDIYN